MTAEGFRINKTILKFNKNPFILLEVEAECINEIKFNYRIRNGTTFSWCCTAYTKDLIDSYDASMTIKGRIYLFTNFTSEEEENIITFYRNLTLNLDNFINV